MFARPTADTHNHDRVEIFYTVNNSAWRDGMAQWCASPCAVQADPSLTAVPASGPEPSVYPSWPAMAGSPKPTFAYDGNGEAGGAKSLLQLRAGGGEPRGGGSAATLADTPPFIRVQANIRRNIAGGAAQ